MQISTARKLERKTDLEKLPNEIKNTIKDKLKSIHIYEEAIIRRKTESLVKHLLDEREIYLMELEEFCKENNLDYRDYYKMCQIGDKSMVI
jgi:hypothetical protein